MKILMLGWELPPNNTGGLGVACYQLCKQLAMQGVEIDFVVPYVPDAPNPFMKLHAALPVTAKFHSTQAGAYDSYCFTCEIHSCEHAMPTDLRSRQRIYNKFVEQLVQDNNYDAIHAHDWLTFEAGAAAKRLTNKPLIAHVHATEFDRAGMTYGNPLVHEIEYNTLLLADRIVAVSQLTKDIIVREYKLPADKVEVVYNSIDPEELGALDADNTYRYLQEMKKHGYKVVVSLGRLTIAKGIHNLLLAARRVMEHDKKILFLVVGDGELREELLVKSAELGVAHNVIFTGFLRGKQWRDAFSIGDMFVLPSVSEPFGLTALEAASYGNAVLLSKQTGVGEIMRSVVRFDFWDVQKFADIILAVARHDSLRTMLSDGARDEVSRMSWEGAARKFQQIYARHLSQGIIS